MARIEDDVQESVEATTNGDSTESTEADTEQADGTETEGNTEGEGVEVSAEEAAAAEAKAKADSEAAEAAAIDGFKLIADENSKHPDRDTSTGELPKSAIDPVAVAYTKLPTAKAKRLVKEYLKGKVESSVLTQDYLSARAYLELNKYLTENLRARETVTKAPVDPTEAYVAHVAALALAPNLVPVPKGVAENWQALLGAKIEELQQATVDYRDWQQAKVDNPDVEVAEPEVDAIVQAAARLASGRSVAGVRRASTATPGAPRAPRASTGDGTRRNIATHIVEAFAERVVDEFLTIAEIAAFKSSEYEGAENPPSQGAIAARLFPGGNGANCTVAGIRPDVQPVDGKDKKGAVKVAAAA